MRHLLTELERRLSDAKLVCRVPRRERRASKIHTVVEVTHRGSGDPPGSIGVRKKPLIRRRLRLYALPRASKEVLNLAKAFLQIRIEKAQPGTNGYGPRKKDKVR